MRISSPGPDPREIKKANRLTTISIIFTIVMVILTIILVWKSL